MAKYRERWEKLKESAKRKRAAKDVQESQNTTIPEEQEPDADVDAGGDTKSDLVGRRYSGGGGRWCGHPAAGPYRLGSVLAWRATLAGQHRLWSVITLIDPEHDLHTSHVITLERKLGYYCPWFVIIDQLTPICRSYMSTSRPPRSCS